ncbi:universal stress protein [Flexivirga lutea]
MSDKKRVVVGVDGSADGDKAVLWAADYAEQIGADLVLVTAWQWPSSYGSPVVWPDFRPDEEARTVLQKVKANVPQGHAVVEAAVYEGRAGRVLVEAAKHAAALVVGSQGHGAVAEALLGSVSAYCVRHAHCPVVVVR